MYALSKNCWLVKRRPVYEILLMGVMVTLLASCQTNAEEPKDATATAKPATVEKQAKVAPKRTERKSTESIPDNLPKRSKSISKDTMSPLEFPNILLVEVDTCRADHLGCYGYSKPTTPNIDEFASQGVVFENFYTTATWTRPSVASLMTSMYPGQLGIANHTSFIPDEPIRMAMCMKQRGLTTLGLSANGHIAKKWGFARGFDEFVEMWMSGKDRSEGLPSEQRALLHAADNVSEALFPMLEKNKDKWTFSFAFYIDPHAPYTRRDEFLPLFEKMPYGGEIDGTIASLKKLNQNYFQNPMEYNGDIAHITNLYDGEIAYFDKFFGMLIDELKELGLYEKTLIVLTSDHGEAFYEHFTRSHGKTVYQYETHVPLIIRGPGVPKGLRVPEVVSSVDIMPSMLEYVGAGIPEQCVGKSFWKLFEEPGNNIRRYAFVDERNKKVRKQAIIADKYKLIYNMNRDTYEFYVLERDPAEREDVFDARHPFIQEFQGMLKECSPYYYENAKNKRVAEKANKKPVDMDKDTLENLKALGYLGN